MVLVFQEDTNGESQVVIKVPLDVWPRLDG
jgi:hypothetical protein